jgi:hypothetical protein
MPPRSRRWWTQPRSSTAWPRRSERSATSAARRRGRGRPLLGSPRFVDAARCHAASRSRSRRSPKDDPPRGASGGRVGPRRRVTPRVPSRRDCRPDGGQAGSWAGPYRAGRAGVKRGTELGRSARTARRSSGPRTDRARRRRRHGRVRRAGRGRGRPGATESSAVDAHALAVRGLQGQHLAPPARSARPPPPAPARRASGRGLRVEGGVACAGAQQPAHAVEEHLRPPVVGVRSSASSVARSKRPRLIERARPVAASAAWSLREPSSECT